MHGQSQRILKPASQATPSARVFERLEQLFAIGGGPGANRPGLSRAEQEACQLTASWMEEAGLDVSWDSAGNLVGRLAGSRPDLPEVWTGSHLDSVPSGGRFDGALGVVAGLEAVEAAGRGERTIAVVAFRDEEGWRFREGCFGSRGLCGLVGDEDLEARDGAGTSVHEALAELGLQPPSPGPLPGVFVEAHVEQGPRLERAGAPLALVTGIVASARGTVVVEGAPGHAGTTPMAARDDALCKAAELVLRLRDAAASVEDAVATVGQVVVEPGATNVIPGRVSLTVDVRAPDEARVERVLAVLPPVELRRTNAVRMSPEPTDALRAELERLGLPVVELASGAGHDAAVLAAAGVPTAMLFVRSLAGGVSHAPEEESSEEDVALCIDVLAGALRRLAS